MRLSSGCTKSICLTTSFIDRNLQMTNSTPHNFSLSNLDDAAVNKINDSEIAARNNELDAKIIECDEAATIKDLAALSTLKYAKRRNDAAREIGISVTALDKAVKEERAANPDTKGQGRPLELPEIEPWPSAVDGA